MKLYLTILIGIITLISMQTISAVTNITACGTLTAGDYEFNKSISGSGTGTCFTINSNVNIDCKNYVLNTTGTAFYTTGKENITIRNCNISNLANNGIGLHSDNTINYLAENITINGKTADAYGFLGFYSSGANSRNITFNKVTCNLCGGNNYVVVFLSGTNDTRVTNLIDKNRAGYGPCYNTYESINSYLENASCSAQIITRSYDDTNIIKNLSFTSGATTTNALVTGNLTIINSNISGGIELYVASAKAIAKGINTTTGTNTIASNAEYWRMFYDTVNLTNSTGSSIKNYPVNITPFVPKQIVPDNMFNDNTKWTLTGPDTYLESGYFYVFDTDSDGVAAGTGQPNPTLNLINGGLYRLKLYGVDTYGTNLTVSLCGNSVTYLAGITQVDYTYNWTCSNTDNLLFSVPASSTPDAYGGIAFGMSLEDMNFNVTYLEQNLTQIGITNSTGFADILYVYSKQNNTGLYTYPEIALQASNETKIVTGVVAAKRSDNFILNYDPTIILNCWTKTNNILFIPTGCIYKLLQGVTEKI